MDQWTPYQPTQDNPWNLKRVVHLHRRAAFAAPRKVIQRDLNDGPVLSIERILNAWQHKDDRFESIAESIGSSAVGSGNPIRLKAWWIYRMLMTPDPLTERLTLMWHNHFATSNLKVDNTVLMHQQNMLLRVNHRGQFKTLLSSIMKHPAMLVWLDADANRKGHPNENLARELLELFTLGIGNYNEFDVRESARALTGWTIQKSEYSFSERRHDHSEKTVLGIQADFDGDQLIEHICQQPATAKRIAWRLCQTFLGENVASEDAIDQLAKILKSNTLDIGAAVECILKSSLFFSESNIRTRICSPAEYVIGAIRSANLQTPPPSTLSLADWLTRMGQDLFYPPNVGGWNEGRSWLSTRNIVARANFAHSFVRGELWNPVIQPDWSRLLSITPTSIEDRIRELGVLMWGHIEERSIHEIATALQHSNDDIMIPNILELMMSHPCQLLG